MWKKKQMIKGIKPKGMHLRPHVLQKELKFIPRSLIISIWP